MAYPDDLPVLTNPVAGASRSGEAATHSVAFDAIEALAARVGLRGEVSPITGWFNVQDYGPMGGADDTATIQAAVDAAAAAGGGVVTVPTGNYVCNNLILKSGVHLTGLGAGTGYGVTRATLRNTAAGWCIDTPGSAIVSPAITGLNITGPGVGTASGGIRFQHVSGGPKISDVYLDGFALQGILVGSDTVSVVLEDIIAINCVLNRSPGALRGAVDVDGTDHKLSRVEGTISGSVEGTVQSVSLYCVGIAVRMTNGSLIDCIGEISDVGIYVTGDLNRFTGCRADLNYGHGWVITGAQNQLVLPLSLSNSQDTTNTYDNYNVPGNQNKLVSPFSSFNTAKAPRYYYNDDTGNGAANRNTYITPGVAGTPGTAVWKTTNSGPAVAFAASDPLTLTANATEPSVEGYTFFKTANSNPTLIYDFAGGVNGQLITIWVNDVNTTLQHADQINTLTGANTALTTGHIYQLIMVGGVWRQIG